MFNSLVVSFILSQGDFLIYFIDYAIIVSFFSPLYFPPQRTLFPPSFPHLSSCPWVIHTSSLEKPLATMSLSENNFTFYNMNNHLP